MWSQVMQRQPQLFLFLGDVVYADKSRFEVWRWPSHLSDMAAIYEMQKTQPGYAALRASDTKIIGMYDDHDYGENDGDGSYVNKFAARQLFLDFIDEPQGTARRTRPEGGIHTSYVWRGPISPAADAPVRSTRLILMDARFFQNATSDDMLGAEQWAWLEAQINTAEPTDLFILTSGVQLVSTDKRVGEGWRLLPRSRARVFDLLAKRRHNKNAMVLFLSGDVHLAETAVTYTCVNDSAETGADSSSGGGVTVHPFYETTSSGLTHSVASHTLNSPALADWILHNFILDAKDSWAEMEAGSGTGIHGVVSRKNVGDVQVDWAAEEVAISYVGEHNEALLTQRIPFAALRPRHLASSKELPQLVQAKCRDEALRAVSPPMFVLAGVRAVFMAVAVLLALLGIPVALLCFCFCSGRSEQRKAADTKQKKQH